MPNLNPSPSRRRPQRVLLAGGALLLLGLQAGCGTLGVEPWQRDLHARADMQWDADAADLAIDEHIHFSKEASSGGRGVGGGGCGCN